MKRLLKSVYRLIPLKKHFFEVLKLFWSPPERIYKHLHFKGKFDVNVASQGRFKIIHYGYQIENEIFWNGILDGWEKYSMRIWIELCRNAQTIFDIGANTGIYSLVAQSLNFESKIYAFEPVHRVFDKLKSNVQLNDYQTTCIKKAASNVDGKAVIYDTDDEHTLSVSVNKNVSITPEDTFEVEIETLTLDSFITLEKISSVDLIKVDVETHEVEVLEGFNQHIGLFKPDMLIEILNHEVALGIEEIIKDLGYYYFNIDELNGIREVGSLGKSDYYNFLICQENTAKTIRSKFISGE